MQTEPAKTPGLVLSPEAEAALLSVAARVFWWGSPAAHLANKLRFAAQVMTYGDWDDVQTTIRLLGKDVFVQVLETPPPGVFDHKSWTYWHHFFKRTPIPPLPSREL